MHMYANCDPNISFDSRDMSILLTLTDLLTNGMTFIVIIVPSQGSCNQKVFSVYHVSDRSY